MHNVAAPAAPIVTAHVPVMTLADMRKSFGPVQALKGVDVLIMPGEVHAIVGENGAGKSTLIGIAAGVLQADAGAIYYDGKYVGAPDPRQMREDGVSVVYQHPALAPDLTVLENLQLAAPSLVGAAGAAEAERLIARVATGELRMPINKRVAELSLAQRHVVEIARAMVTRPKVLFLDEPTEPLQAGDVRKLFDLIGELFPAKATSVGPALFSVKGLSGRGFDQVDLVVHAGEIVGLAGIEGEGQREFIRAAAGIDRRHAGGVRVRDAAISGDSPGAFRKAGIGFISDDRHTEGVFLSLTLR